MAVVIELEGYWQRDISNLVVKEFCVVSIESNIFAHCLLKPPHDCVTQHDPSSYHGIKWNDGFVHYEDGIQLLKHFVLTATAIYIKGDARCNFISNITRKEPINLESMGMPSTLEKLELSNSAVSCFFPPHTTSTYVCAVECAQKYKQWLLQQHREIQ